MVAKELLPQISFGTYETRCVFSQKRIDQSINQSVNQSIILYDVELRRACLLYFDALHHDRAEILQSKSQC
jgi:hypothetical protein